MKNVCEMVTERTFMRSFDMKAFEMWKENLCEYSPTVRIGEYVSALDNKIVQF